jgi:hypothetical protein
MVGVAMSIIKGNAKYFDEEDKVNIMQCTPLDAEQVQIKVDILG